MVLGTGFSGAQPAGSAEAARETAPRNYGNFRVGASTLARHPTLCLELSFLEMLSVEGCGTGSGFLHHDPGPEIAHFRAHLRLTSWKTTIGWLQPRLSAGFAEMQVGEDGVGFHFNGTGLTGVETAGPEVGTSLRALLPVYDGFEFVGELGLNIAYFRHAPQLLRPQPEWQPGASLSLGIGF
ncbi:hypothetical protein F0U63_37790 [Cystobacter fuscus]|nr:hypothetical protein F0U63_37790 [Cystobacter fuscus]